MPAELRARRLFGDAFGGEPTHLVRAPGRVNLIGDHTDYNDGFVLPMAIGQATWIAMRPRTDGVVSAVSEGFEPVEFSLDVLEHGGPAWAEYLKGVAWALGPARVGGWDGAIATDVPVGAGLSSSAAIEVAAGLAFTTAAGVEMLPTELATAAQRGDNEWVGISSGIMDQLTSASGRAGHAVLIDCRSLAVTPHPLPAGVAVAVLDTGTRRRLVDSAYNERRAACDAVAQAYGVAALRDLGAGDLDDPPAVVTDVQLRRARHVISENERVLAAVAAMGDPGEFGRLMVTSHESLRDDYEVSTPELETVVAAAAAAPGCFGARLTGAGFGGAAVALVAAGEVDAFTDAMAGWPVLVTEAGDGARVVDQDGAG